jgi:amino acid adenylation domain-containing protein
MPQSGAICTQVGMHRSERVALLHGNHSLSYFELNRRVEQLAAYLIELNRTPSPAIAVCLERSIDWVITALAIMRAGAAYVPMDTAWPDERLRYVVKDSGATHLIASRPTQARLATGIIGIDPSADAGHIAECKPLAGSIPSTDDLAYIIYTSGSSGYPKGVEITHANLRHLVQWHQNAFKVTESDRASHLAGLSFDAAGWEIWPYLAAGATVAIVDEDTRSSPEQLQQWLLQNQISVSYVPTAIATSLIGMAWPSSTPLRFLLTGGDTLHRWPPAGLPFAVVNNYGPTECTVVATSAVVEPNSPSVVSSSAPPIGRPIDGATIHLLNEDGSPTPKGSIGEICIGGGGVGKGYRNLPDLTDASFVHNPFSQVAGARLYRSGDMGRLLPDGQIEFHGRRDFQEKIRGQRIELDEIGSVLHRHPKVDFAVVAALPNCSGEKRLVGYVLPHRSTELTSTELQEFLTQSLPCYMVPTAFVRLRSVPLTRNGKIDRKALEAPSSSNLLPAAISSAPKSDLAEALLQIVRELLESDNVGVEDDFFLAGGHSLLGSQLIMRVRDTFQVELLLRDLFEARTVERLALKTEELLIAQVDAMTEEEAQREVEASR